MLRRPFSTGLPVLGSVAAAFSSFVGLPAWSVVRPICEYVWPPVASSVCLRMTLANACASAPVSTFWPGMVESGVPTICSRARSERTRSRPLAPATMVPMPRAMSAMLAKMPAYLVKLLMVALLVCGSGSWCCVIAAPIRAAGIPSHYENVAGTTTPACAGNPQARLAGRLAGQLAREAPEHRLELRPLVARPVVDEPLELRVGPVEEGGHRLLAARRQLGAVVDQVALAQRQERA